LNSKLIIFIHNSRHDTITHIGYLAVHPEAEDAGLVASAVAVANTMLCVNAPNMLQLAVAQLQGVTVDVSIYRKRRDMLCQGLREIGYDFNVPDGAFYLFPKTPLLDDVKFVGILKEAHLTNVCMKIAM
jgi:aspartate aminotransferase